MKRGFCQCEYSTFNLFELLLCFRAICAFSSLYVSDFGRRCNGLSSVFFDRCSHHSVSLLHFAPCSIKPIKIDFVYCEYLAVGCANGGLAG